MRQKLYSKKMNKYKITYLVELYCRMSMYNNDKRDFIEMKTI